MSTRDRTVPVTTRWAVPLTAFVIGLAYLAAGLASGNESFGIGGLVLMVAVGLGFLVLGRYSETAAGLRDRTDERINAIDRDASLWSGMSVLGVVLVMFVVEVARGQDGQPYALLGAVGGVVYLGSLVVLRLRR